MNINEKDPIGYLKLKVSFNFISERAYGLVCC
jgi:hypothetical protein